MQAGAAGGNAGWRLGPALVSLGYLFAGTVWIAFSDLVAGVLFTSQVAIDRFQTYKGIAFVGGTALLIFVLLLRRERRNADAFGSSRLGIGPLLTGLILVTAIPLVAILGFNVYREAQVQLHGAGQLVHRGAELTAARATAWLNEHERHARAGAHRALENVAGGCTVALRELRRLHGELQALAVLDTLGQPLCRAPGPLAVPVDPAMLHPGGPPQVTMVMSGGRAEAVAITYPISMPGATAAAVQVVLPLASLASVLAAPLTDGGVAGLVSADGYVIARAPAMAAVQGRKVDAAVEVQNARAQGRDSFRSTGADGVGRFYAWRSVGQSGMLALAGVSLEGVYGPVRRGALAAAGTAAAVLVLAALLAVKLVRSISWPMKALAETAARAANGQFDRLAPEEGPREIAGVAAQFNRMLARLPALERELHQREAYHRELLDKLSRNIPGMIYQYRIHPDGSSDVPFVSDACSWMFGVQREEVTLPRLLENVHPEDRALLQDGIAQGTRTLSPVMIEYRVELPWGRQLHHLALAQPEREEDGTVLWHGCTVDTTALEVAKQELRAANEQLEVRVAARTRELAAANEALESFSYSVAHDLRAPLQVVAGFAQALAEAVERGDTSRVSWYTQRVTTNTQAMERMIDGLLAVARAGKGELQEKAVALDAMVAHVVEELQVPPQAQVRVAPLPQVRADPNSLRQVWWNLLANALKFSGGREAPQIDVGVDAAAGEVVFWVRDNGAGFDPQFAQRLFGAFQRLHGANEFEGTGIGLALVRRIVERHGGRVWAEGQPDAGACFYFSLPAQRVVQAV